MIVGSSIMLLVGAFLLVNLKSDLAPQIDKEVSIENQTFYKIILAMICGVISGLFILNIDTIGL